LNDLHLGLRRHRDIEAVLRRKMTKRIATVADPVTFRAKCSARSRAYRLRNPELWAAIKRKSCRKLKLEVMNHYGGKCACCGESILEFLAIDHPNGGGNKDRIEKCGAKNRGGDNFYRTLKRLGFPSGYRVLCHNCNQARGYYGGCPHGNLSEVENAA